MVAVVSSANKIVKRTSVDVGPKLASRINSDANPMSNISADSKKSMFISYITEYEITTILAGINYSSPNHL